MTRPVDATSLVGIVLAGGRSTRMGEDKAGLVYGGQTLLDHARALLEAAGCSSIYVSGRPDEPDGLEDTNPGGGPAHAIIDMLDRFRSQAEG
ncbi:MAG TPA: molybdenum cofactor guanylyltransferase, partial [Myxococcales bacterium]|nr:molybdenum cofactor guanylyltransferase [Myxococcales bacterium]